ncbi:MAG: hypothetical protein ACJAXA_001837 [Candidatus Aldehydirespiratoraceae bacterium]|jgi:hypothetical protein
MGVALSQSGTTMCFVHAALVRYLPPPGASPAASEPLFGAKMSRPLGAGPGTQSAKLASWHETVHFDSELA